ncbi:ATP-binding protein [Robertmurraya sp. DFI.2.37]|uniref:sensor histidine kinase n=1 Tax=Robertmurraya sp. DFI.2.37 TaxID=3031819 RepID=UPI001246CBE4|nr:ATP-binding protein [Robertmurraya sp. DFI.2.37]MDF1511046.1 ATP-binding protein [Robertmurraya sp. DFI.2.37]
MHLTLRSRILFYFLIVSLCGILLTSISISWGFEDQFTDYLRANREQDISLLQEEAAREYKESGSLLNDDITGLLHEQAMTENLFYQIHDKDGKLLADTTMMLGMMESMGRQSDSVEYLSSTYDLSIEKQVIGSIKVYYPDSLMDEDFSFLNTIKKNIYVGAIITIILSFVFSILFSKRLTTGFNTLSKAVQALQKHKWNTRVTLDELSKEMQPLANTFNNLAEALSKEETLRKQFTADLAHELRTPLATLRSQIEAYQDGVWEPTPKRLQQSHDELMRLVRLVNELEKLLAAENPQIKLKKTDIEANKILNRIKTQFESAFNEKRVKLTISISEKEHWFHADRDRVIQILTNIVNNALQYTQPGKQVIMSIEEKSNMIGFSIKDEGIGIKEHDLPYLYERFYRGDKSRDRKTGGIGIGLSIVKALVDAHQGEIKIESKINVGTTVTIYFPQENI